MKSPALDRTEATRVLRLAYAAYCPGRAIESWCCYWCAESGLSNASVVTDATYRTQGFVALREATEEIVVAFRGTVNDGDDATSNSTSTGQAPEDDQYYLQDQTGPRGDTSPSGPAPSGPTDKVHPSRTKLSER